MTINIVLAFDNYAEFVRSLTPDAIDELMKDKEPVIPSAYEWLNAARIEGGKLPEPTVPEPDCPEPQAMAVPMSAAEPGLTTGMTVEEIAEKVELAEVRKLLAEISRKKGKEASKALIQAAGAERLTEVAPEKLADLYAAAKEVAADAR